MYVCVYVYRHTHIYIYVYTQCIKNSKPRLLRLEDTPPALGAEPGRVQKPTESGVFRV